MKTHCISLTQNLFIILYSVCVFDTRGPNYFFIFTLFGYLLGIFYMRMCHPEADAHFKVFRLSS